MTARKSSLFSINEKSIQPYDIEEQGKRGDPICVSTLSSHCNGPFKCNSIQQGVDVTVCRRYAAPQPFTKLILIVHIRVNWYTASNPCETDCDNNAANSWLLNIFKLQPVRKKSICKICFDFFIKEHLTLNYILTGWYFTNSGWMPTITLITIRTLHENARIGQTFGKYFTTDII